MLEISGIGILSAFGAGLISFLSPCVLPLVPGYLSYIGGQSLDEMREREISSRETLAILALSFSFILGFASVFIAFGASATFIGRLLMVYRYESNIAGGIIVIVFGLFLTGLLRFGWLQREFRFHGPRGKGAHPAGAYLLGLAFAFGWTPCIGPILGAILTISATASQSSSGAALLAIYSMGLGVPFAAAAIFTDKFLRYSKRVRRHGQSLQIVAGAVLIVMGLLMVTGYLTVISLWFLHAFPWLTKLG